MTLPSVAPGCVFHWKDYEFDDGETANKYFVFVGAKTGCNFLAVIATSKPHRRSFVPGCHAEHGYYHIPGVKDGFKKDTWLLIAEPREIAPDEFLKLAKNGTIQLEYELRGDVANGIMNCMRQCNDVSPYHASLLGPPIQPAKK